MRLAVLSDIHGNLLALQAVLADLQAAGGADLTWILGDLAFLGPEPAACIQAVQQLENAKIIRGNTDRYLITGVRPQMPKFTEENWQDIVTRTRQNNDIFLWTLDQLSWNEIQYVQDLGTDLAHDIEDFGWIVGFHAIPSDDEGYLFPNTPDHEIRDALLDREGKLALGGHTHHPMNRDVGNWRMVNPGSIGFPFDGDTRAAYAILTFENGNVQVDLRRVEYDIEATIQAYRDFPALALASRRLRNAEQ